MNFDFKKRYKKIIYTLKHKKAFLLVERQLRGKNTLRGYLHDLDKPFLYMAFWIKLEDIQKIHRNRNAHHVRNNLPKTREDLIDSIIDWECARLTKPDKPLNAYQTLIKFYPDQKETFLPLIKELLPAQIKKETQSPEHAASFSSAQQEHNCEPKRQTPDVRPIPSLFLRQAVLNRKSR